MWKCETLPRFNYKRYEFTKHFVVLLHWGNEGAANHRYLCIWYENSSHLVEECAQYILHRHRDHITFHQWIVEFGEVSAGLWGRCWGPSPSSISLLNVTRQPQRTINFTLYLTAFGPNSHPPLDFRIISDFCSFFTDKQFPIDLNAVQKDHQFLEPDALQSLFRRFQTLNKCANMKVELMPTKLNQVSTSMSIDYTTYCIYCVDDSL